MRFVRAFFGGVWRLAALLWPFAGSGQMLPRAGTLWTFVFFLFAIVFAIAWLFGISPSELTAWLDAHSDLFVTIANWLWRIFWGVVLFVCGLSIFGVCVDMFGARAPEFEGTPRSYKSGGCTMIAIAFVAYVAWVAITLED